MEKQSKPAVVPIRPCSEAFAEYEPLMTLCQCWETARGSKVLPTRFDFDRVILDFPTLLPNMAFLESDTSGELRVLFFGSNLVTRLNNDPTYDTVNESLAPNVKQVLLDWGRSLFSIPHFSFWTARGILSDGSTSQTSNLSVVISDNDSSPSHLAIVSVLESTRKPPRKRQKMKPIGPAGVDIMPIDIGYGIPSLPRSVV